MLLGARYAGRGARASRQLGGGLISPVVIDVDDDDSVRAAAAGVAHLDILINNAAILYDTWQGAVDADLDQVHEALETNLLGAWRVTQAFLPQLRASPAGRIVNVSSGAGAIHARLPRLQGGAQRAHARLRRGAAPRRHPRQRGLPRLGGDRHGRQRRASGG